MHSTYDHKVLNFFTWLASSNHHSSPLVLTIINHQKLKKLLDLSGCIYPDLVKVFYTNLTIDGDNMNSHMKGVDIEITPKVWFAVTGLRYEGQ